MVSKSIEIKSQSSEMEKVCREILGEAVSSGFSEDDVFAIHLALEEAFINAVKHGNKDDLNKKISIDYIISDDKFEITVSDEGEGFHPDVVPDPRSDENICKSSGRGLLLIRSYMDKVEYSEKGNAILMVKNKTKGNL
ncbi:MAG: ATP-binding protein [Planctomycetes bacterium]|nr:ATP-binding protein [Planctomycetota bacterium]